MEIRPYAPADWPRIEAVHDAARKIELHQAGLDGAFLPLSIAAQREGLFDYTILVAQDTEVTGFVAFTQEELAWLYVDPARHRRGIGRLWPRPPWRKWGRGPGPWKSWPAICPLCLCTVLWDLPRRKLCTAICRAMRIFPSPSTACRLRRSPRNRLKAGSIRPRAGRFAAF